MPELSSVAAEVVAADVADDSDDRLVSELPLEAADTADDDTSVVDVILAAVDWLLPSVASVASASSDATEDNCLESAASVDSRCHAAPDASDDMLADSLDNRCPAEPDDRASNDSVIFDRSGLTSA